MSGLLTGEGTGIEGKGKKEEEKKGEERREGGREGGREKGMEGRRDGGREGGREGGKEDHCWRRVVEREGGVGRVWEGREGCGWNNFATIVYKQKRNYYNEGC